MSRYSVDTCEQKHSAFPCMRNCSMTLLGNNHTTARQGAMTPPIVFNITAAVPVCHVSIIQVLQDAVSRF
jgi:hypothetical protein